MNLKPGTTSSLRTNLLRGAAIVGFCASVVGCASPGNGTVAPAPREPVVSYQCGCSMPSGSVVYVTSAEHHSRGHSGKD